MSLIAKDLATGYFQGKSSRILHQNIHFEAKPGDIILLAGPNGVGKSVFLKTLMGIAPMLSGSLYAMGSDITRNSRRQELMALMLATPPQIELMSPLEIILTASSKTRFFQSFSQDEIQKARLELSLCKLSHLENASFNTLSDGEKQKIMLARSLFQNTPFVLLDEPTAFLDYPSKIDFWSQIQERATKNQTAFIVCTHDLHIAHSRVNTVWLMNKQEFRVFKNPTEFEIDFVKSDA